MTAATLHLHQPGVRVPRFRPAPRSSCPIPVRAGTPAVQARRRPRAVAAPVVTTSHRLRITRRGRLAVFLGTTALVCAAVVPTAQSALATPDSAPAQATWVTVMPGETLWDLAASSGLSQDTRDAVVTIADYNGLASAQIAVGDRIAIPAD